MSKGGGRMTLGNANGRSKVTRAEYDDNVLRDNVRMDNKHLRSLKVHERAKNVVSRTIDKEALMFKQRQSAQKTRLPGLNAQGQQRPRASKPDTTNWIPDFSLTASPRQEVTNQNDTLSPLVSQSPVDRKSPLSPRDPFPQYGQLSGFTTGQRNGHLSPEVLQKTDTTSEKFKKPNGVAEPSIILPQRRMMRIGSKERFDDPFDSNPRLKSASRKLYLDSKGILREQTVFDFLSKPKHNTELKKRLDTRIRLEKEFTPRKSISEKSGNKTQPFGFKPTGTLYKSSW